MKLKGYKDVFVVHRFETGDVKYHVTYGTFTTPPKKPEIRTRKFTDWGEAMSFAIRKAKQMKLKKLTVDHPNYSGSTSVSDLANGKGRVYRLLGGKPLIESKKAPISKRNFPKLTPRLRRRL